MSTDGADETEDVVQDIWDVQRQITLKNEKSKKYERKKLSNKVVCVCIFMNNSYNICVCIF